MYDKLLALLSPLDGVQQDRRYHPEGDALYHSLQVFENACKETDDEELLMASLVHDVGKAVDSAHHAEVGADMLEDLAPRRVTWLVRHHLDLLKTPALTKQRLFGTAQLADLKRLRRWDLAGRKVKVWVPTLENALFHLMNRMNHNEAEFCDSSSDPSPSPNHGGRN